MSKKVMVVDDSRIVQLQMQKLLADTDYKIVACCQSGEDALRLYDETNPDLVTMDILMPGMDGLEAARLIGQQLDRGSTMLKAIGTYSGTERQLLLCACSNREAYKVTGIVHKQDDSAMVMVCEASEVYGEGFRLPES